MYHLRKITKEGVETNHALGNQYTIIRKDKNEKQFVKTVEAYFPDGISDEIYCFVSSSFGHIFGLEEEGQAYIMTESGSTFSNLTSRGKNEN